MTSANVDPTGMVSHKRLAFAQDGPPSKNVPAQPMKIAQGGRLSAVPPMNAVRPARMDATISWGMRSRMDNLQ